MKATFKINEPNKVECSMTITQSLGDWIELQNKLPGDWPCWPLSKAISDLVRNAKTQFETTEESK